MEIHINIPETVQPLIRFAAARLLEVSQGWNQGLSLLKDSIDHVLHLPSNALVPIVAILLVFWPVLLTLVVAFFSASTWIFWLFTSIVFGLLQLMYVTYQFFMIAGDIMGLSVFKTYSMLRNMFLNMVDKTSGTNFGKSRRRLWRERAEKAGTYESFLKIRIEPKDESKVRLLAGALSKPTKARSDPDTALPPLSAQRTLSDPGTKDQTVLRHEKGTFHPEGAELPVSVRRSSSFTDTDPKFVPNKESPLLPRIRSLSRDIDLQAQQNISLSPNQKNDISVVAIELGEKTADLLAKTTERLNEARVTAERESSEEAASSLKYLLCAVVKRNHLQLDDILLENARSIAESGQYGLTSQSRQLIRAYYAEVQRCLDWLVDAPVLVPSENSEKDDEFSSLRPNQELVDRVALIRRMKQNMGRTALMLSGGGAQAMYHTGIIRALIQSQLYNDIKVVSGTSGGSIIAAMCAIKTSDELFTDVCVPNVSTDFMRTGEQKKKNIRWFPTVTEMASYWFKNKLLMDNFEFRRTCEYYYGSYTFEEAYERTGKHVCITVSASRATGNTAQRLLLNHISTPHVTLASAVAASCALPGVMAPAKLLTKNSAGVLEPFEVDGVEWIDGSVQADLPFERISTLFAVTSFIVSQTNFHIVPFLNKAHHPNRRSLYWRLFQTLEWDIRSRALKLSRLGLFPRIFGQDISKVFKQKYYGNLTIVPRFTTMQTFGLKALSNPTVKDMEGYLKYGQLATWPYLNAIRDMIRLEKSLDDCLARLENRLRVLNPSDDWSYHGDIDSIGSSSHPTSSMRASVRIVGPPPVGIGSSYRETERMKKKNEKLEEENQTLKDKLHELERLLLAKDSSSTKGVDGSTQERGGEVSHTIDQTTVSLSDGAEGDVWNILHRPELTE